MVVLFGVNCVEDRAYHAQTSHPGDEVPDKGDGLDPDLDLDRDPDLDPVDDIREPTQRREVTETPIETPCEVPPPLTHADLDPGNETPFREATVQENQRDGAVVHRTLRRFGDDGARIWQHEEAYNNEGCLGVATTRAWDAAGNLVLYRVVVLDDEVGAMLSPYMPLVSLERSWTFTADGRPLTKDTDLGADGSVEHRVTHTYDDRGLLVYAEATRLVEIAPEEMWRTPANLDEWTRKWTHDARGNAATEIHTSDVGQRITRTTWDEYDQVLTRTIHRDEVRLVLLTNTWAGEGVQLSSVSVNRQGRGHDIRWSYRDGVLARMVRHEDFNNDGRFDRLEIEEYDLEGRVVVRQVDQPLDHYVDLHQTFVFDAEGRPLESRSINPQIGQVLGVQSWTYDEEGRELTHVVQGRDGVPLRREVREYDPRGNLVRTARYVGDELRAEEKNTYDADDRRVRTEHDFNGDGVFDGVWLLAWDRAGNLILLAADWTNNGTFEETFFLY
jgi:YD repeat-containing protein